MGQPSKIDDPFSWKDWFNAFLIKIRGAGVNKIPDHHIRFMNHAFIAGWNSRGNAEKFLRDQAQHQNLVVQTEMENDVTAYWKEIEAEHDAMDDLMNDLKPS